MTPCTMQPVQIEIMGHHLTVVSDEGEEHVREVAAYVDARMRQLAEGRAAPSILYVALVAALNMASEYHKLRRVQDDVSQRIDRVSQRVIKSLG